MEMVSGYERNCEYTGDEIWDLIEISNGMLHIVDVNYGERKDVQVLGSYDLMLLWLIQFHEI